MAIEPAVDPRELLSQVGVMKIEQILCTPDKARELLNYNTFLRQRSYRAWYAEYLAEEMKLGRFLAFERIELCVVGSRMVLTDGQHRLNAVLVSGIPQFMEIVYFAVPDEATLGQFYSRRDAGLIRSQKDRLRALDVAKRLGLTETQSLVGCYAMRLVMAEFRSRGPRRTSHEDVVAGVTAWADGLRTYLGAIAGCPSDMAGPMMRASTAAVGIVTCQEAPSRIGMEKVRDFWWGVAYDDGLRIGDTRKTLNKDLLANGLASRGPQDHRDKVLSSEEATWRVARCWNAWVRDENLLQIQAPGTFFPIRIDATRFDGAADKAKSNGKAGGKAKGKQG